MSHNIHKIHYEYDTCLHIVIKTVYLQVFYYFPVFSRFFPVFTRKISRFLFFLQTEKYENTSPGLEIRYFILNPKGSVLELGAEQSIKHTSTK